MAAAFGGPRPRDRKSLSCSRRAPVGVAATRARSDCHDGAESGERPMRNKMGWTSMDVLIFCVRWLARRPSRRTDGARVQARAASHRRPIEHLRKKGRTAALINTILNSSPPSACASAHTSRHGRAVQRPTLITHHSLVATPKRCVIVQVTLSSHGMGLSLHPLRISLSLIALVSLIMWGRVIKPLSIIHTSLSLSLSHGKPFT